jgi:hypothetical protein
MAKEHGQTTGMSAADIAIIASPDQLGSDIVATLSRMGHSRGNRNVEA